MTGNEALEFANSLIVPEKDPINPTVDEVGMNVGRLIRFVFYQTRIMSYCAENNVDYATFLRLVTQEKDPMYPPRELCSHFNYRSLLEIFNNQVNGRPVAGKNFGNAI
jgi:hypothetical protein